MTTPQTQKLVESMVKDFEDKFETENLVTFSVGHPIGKEIKKWLKSSLSLVLKQEQERIRKVVERLPVYEVTDDVKDKDGDWIEFYEIKVVRHDDLLKEIID